jgi:hypothetical protein
MNLNFKMNGPAYFMKIETRTGGVQIYFHALRKLFMKGKG